MTLAEFERSLTQSKPPDGLTPVIAALWWAGKDDWKKAHDIVMDAGDKPCAWVHAYLHRLEGDLPNARYWYRHAGKPLATQSLREEWTAIVRTMLASGA
jgi:hypothetical protein